MESESADQDHSHLHECAEDECDHVFLTRQAYAHHRRTEHTPPYQDAELLEELYYEQLLDSREIGEKLDCSPSTVRMWMDEYGIERRGLGERWQLRQARVRAKAEE